MTNPDDKLDENRYYNDVSNHPLSSADFDMSSFKSMLYQKEKRKPGNKVKQLRKQRLFEEKKVFFKLFIKFILTAKIIMMLVLTKPVLRF